MVTDDELDDVAFALARRLDLAMFFHELRHEHQRISVLENEATRLRQVYGIDVSHLVDEARG